MEVRTESIKWIFCFSDLTARIPDLILDNQFSAFSGELGN